MCSSISVSESSDASSSYTVDDKLDLIDDKLDLLDLLNDSITSGSGMNKPGWHSVETRHWRFTTPVVKPEKLWLKRRWFLWVEGVRDNKLWDLRDRLP